MLYFLKLTFHMHESHILSFLTHFPFICYNDTNFRPVPMSRANGFSTLPPFYVDAVLSNGRNTKIRMVLENRKCGFVPGKDNFYCIEVSVNTVHRQQTS